MPPSLGGSQAVHVSSIPCHTARGMSGQYLGHRTAETRHHGGGKQDESEEERQHRDHLEIAAKLRLESFLSTLCSNSVETEMPATHHGEDGGVVCALFLMAAVLAYTLFSAVAFYADATAAGAGERPELRKVRLLAGYGNLGNSVAHALLVVYMSANAGNSDPYWEKERTLGGIEGPAVIALINGAVGLLAIRARWLRLSFGWNSFVAIVGTLMPIVWPRFLSEGLATWPAIVIFLWFTIFAMELTASASSATWLALADREDGRKDK